MKYKIGDVVRIKSLRDIAKVMDCHYCVGGIPIKSAMNIYCGAKLTIDQVDDINGYYRMKEDPWHFYNDEMIECIASDSIETISTHSEAMSIMSEMNKELLSVIKKYPDYEIKGIVGKIDNWGWLTNIEVCHMTKIIKLYFGYKF